MIKLAVAPVPPLNQGHSPTTIILPGECASLSIVDVTVSRKLGRPGVGYRHTQ